MDKKKLETIKKLYSTYLSRKLKNIKLIDKGEHDRPYITLEAEVLNSNEMQALLTLCKLISNEIDQGKKLNIYCKSILANLCNYIDYKTLPVSNQPSLLNDDCINNIPAMVQDDVRYLLSLPEYKFSVKCIMGSLLNSREKNIWVPLSYSSHNGKTIHPSLENYLPFMSGDKIKAFCNFVKTDEYLMIDLFDRVNLNIPIVTDTLYKYLVAPVLKNGSLEELFKQTNYIPEVAILFSNIIEKNYYPNRFQKANELKQVIEAYRNKFEDMLNNGDFSTLNWYTHDFFYKYYLENVLFEKNKNYEPDENSIKNYLAKDDSILNPDNNKYQNLEILIKECSHICICEYDKNKLLDMLPEIYDEVYEILAESNNSYSPSF